MPERLRSEIKYWNEFYDYSFNNTWKNRSVRKSFNEHFLPGLEIKFIRGKTEYGRNLFEKELDDDINYRTSYKLGTIFNLKDIGILQGENINSKEFPDRCLPTSTLIFNRKIGKTFLLRFQNSLILKSGRDTLLQI